VQHHWTISIASKVRLGITLKDSEVIKHYSCGQCAKRNSLVCLFDMKS